MERRNRHSAEIAIPWTHLGGQPEVGKEVAFNLSGHDYEDGFVAWSPAADARDTKAFGRFKLLP